MCAYAIYQAARNEKDRPKYRQKYRLIWQKFLRFGFRRKEEGRKILRVTSMIIRCAYSVALSAKGAHLVMLNLLHNCFQLVNDTR
ncbi:hypothetical protein CEXT_121871 [Caerostris extrusa]|uniref:Uncharacterized protein n=1 Tax=Caerostris extrusa TaxID=172846 RepID=A0AAV4MA74_CAEEX|nr:hypothetical protein CEXT_121871 [Caerostris extrusa]